MQATIPWWCARHQTIVKLSRIISATCAISIKQIASAALVISQSAAAVAYYLFIQSSARHGFLSLYVRVSFSALRSRASSWRHFDAPTLSSLMLFVFLSLRFHHRGRTEIDAFNLFSVASSCCLKFSNSFLCDYFLLPASRRGRIIYYWTGWDSFFRTWFPDDLRHYHKKSVLLTWSSSEWRWGILFLFACTKIDTDQYYSNEITSTKDIFYCW